MCPGYIIPRKKEAIPARRIKDIIPGERPVDQVLKLRRGQASLAKAPAFTKTLEGELVSSFQRVVSS